VRGGAADVVDRGKSREATAEHRDVRSNVARQWRILRRSISCALAAIEFHHQRFMPDPESDMVQAEGAEQLAASREGFLSQNAASV
jgi:hypothetical protein